MTNKSDETFNHFLPLHLLTHFEIRSCHWRACATRILAAAARTQNLSEIIFNRRLIGFKANINHKPQKENLDGIDDNVNFVMALIMPLMVSKFFLRRPVLKALNPIKLTHMMKKGQEDLRSLLPRK